MRQDDSKIATDARKYGRPSRGELEEIFVLKHGRPDRVGWTPRWRWQADYWLPADVYEALVAKLVFPGCSWLDIGGGHSLFPENPKLAESLVARSAITVAVDPSGNVQSNVHVHERVQCAVEDYQTARRFDVATLRMVAEHVDDPHRFAQAVVRLLSPGGVVVVFTVNRLSPLTIVSRWTPFALHHPIKKRFWTDAKEDTFPVRYRMNSRRSLARLFEAYGCREVSFAYLDDLSTWSRFKMFNRIELFVWKQFRRARIRYPEHCLLGVYQK